MNLNIPLDPEQLVRAQELLRRKDHAVLSTHSVELEGFPFGSVLSYCLDHDGIPLVLISDIAQHTKNISRNSAVSITILENNGGDPQSEGRLTLLGHMVEAEDQVEIKARYERYFPQSKFYHEVHDFSFYKLELKRARYIGGFGKIYWLEPEELIQTNVFEKDAEKFILDHMNDHHRDSLRKYVTEVSGQEEEEENYVMCGIDRLGVDILAGHKKYRIAGLREMNTVKEAREVLTEMAMN